MTNGNRVVFLLTLALAAFLTLPAQAQVFKNKSEKQEEARKEGIFSSPKKTNEADRPAQSRNGSEQDHLKAKHKSAKSEVRIAKRERKVAEAREEAARARAEAIRAEKRAVRFEDKAVRTEGRAAKAREKGGGN
jgi:hypothetical protein